MNWLFRVKFSLVAQIIPQVCVTWIQPIQHRDSGKLNVSPFWLKTMGLVCKAFSLAISEARIVSPKRVASQGKATILALPLKASLALLHRVLLLSEAEIASLLALSGASFLTSRLRFLALSALVLASRLKTLALGAGSESDAESTMLLAQEGTLALASRDRQG